MSVCPIADTVLNYELLNRLLPTILPLNYVSAFLKSNNFNQIRNLAFSIAPYALPFIVLLLVVFLGFAVCLCQCCCRKGNNCCRDKTYTLKQINCCTILLTILLVLAMIIGTFSLIVGFDFLAGYNNMNCRVWQSVNAAVNGQINLINPQQSFIGFNSISSVTTKTTNSYSDNILYLSSQFAALSIANPTLLSPTLAALCASLTITLPSGVNTKLGIASKVCQALTPESSQLTNAATSMNTIKTQLSGPLSSSMNLGTYVSQVNGLSSYVSSLSTTFSDYNNKLSSYYKLNQLSSSLAVYLLLGLNLFFLITSFLSIVFPFLLDCYSCAWLLKLSWFLNSFLVMLICLITAVTGAGFVIFGNTSLTVTDILANPASYSILNANTEIKTCITTPTKNLFDLAGSPLTGTDQIIYNSLLSTGSSYKQLVPMSLQNSSSGTFIPVVDSYLYSPLTIPQAADTTFINSTFCANRPSYTVTFNPGFCKGKIIVFQNPLPAEGCIQLTTTSADCSAIPAADPIQCITVPSYVSPLDLNTLLIQANCQQVSKYIQLGTSSQGKLAAYENSLIKYSNDYQSLYRTVYNTFTLQTRARLGQLVSYTNQLSYGISCTFVTSKLSAFSSDLNLMSSISLVSWAVLVGLSCVNVLVLLVSFCMISRLQVFEQKHGKVHLIPLDIEDVNDEEGKQTLEEPLIELQSQ